MKVILDPIVTVVGKPEFIEHPVYKIPSDGTDAEQLASFAAKSCYDSFGEDGRSNIENQKAILEHKHGSAVEHVHFSLFIEGITRACSLELNRHRPENISQRSTRYVKEEDSAIVLEPYYAKLFKRFGVENRDDRWVPMNTAAWTEDRVINEWELIYNFLSIAETSIIEYQNEVKILMQLNPDNLSGFDLRKWARGKARNILPHALETRGVWTNNIRGWRWFIESRSNRHAEPEIRRLADHVLQVLKPLSPIHFEDFYNNGEYDGIIEWVPQYSKI